MAQRQEGQHQASTTVSAGEWYARKILGFSRVSAGNAYVSGLHYDRLATFLLSPYKTYGSEGPPIIADDRFDFLTLYDLSRSRQDARRSIAIRSPAEAVRLPTAKRQEAAAIKGQSLEDTAAQKDLSETDRLSTTSQSDDLKPVVPGRIVFMRGFASPTWLNNLGASLDVDPELFYRHLEMPKGQLHRDIRSRLQYSTPFPKTRDLIRMKVCNIGSFVPNSPDSSLQSLRESCQEEIRRSLIDFTKGEGTEVGQTLIRRLVIHDMQNFSIDQRISVEVIHHTSPWSIVIWMDIGRKEGMQLQHLAAFASSKLHPVYQHHSRMATNAHTGAEASWIPSSSSGDYAQRFSQSVDHLHENYGRHLKPDLMAVDAFYALHELFEFSAFSIDQVLELLEDNISRRSIGSTDADLTELLLTNSLLLEYQKNVSDIHETICARGSPNWPRAKDPGQCAQVEQAAKELEDTYARILKRCTRLSEQCAGSVSTLLSLATQRQSEKAIDQADKLSKLSLLAYFYIPITFAASFFGMNFLELGNQLSVWTYFAMAGPLLLVSLVAWFIDFSSLWTSCKEGLKTAARSSRSLRRPLHKYLGH